jgi:hypothetical protein
MVLVEDKKKGQELPGAKDSATTTAVAKLRLVLLLLVCLSSNRSSHNDNDCVLVVDIP